jgi:TolB-like protein/DNA-binding winged helix-turn-helix (wHTH) protein
MEAQTRRTDYEFGDFRVDTTQQLLLLKADGRALPLSSRAFDALICFLEHPGELLDKSALMRAIWPNVVVEENNLNQQISALRRVLGERPDEHRFIVTVAGRGYRFVAEVKAVPPADALAAAGDCPVRSHPSPVGFPTTSSSEEVSGHQAAGGLKAKGPVLALGSAAVVLIAASLAWLFTHRAMQQASPAGPAAAPVESVEVVAARKPRLAILPFENLSPDPANAFFADGLHEEIVSTIAERVPGIEVISRTTMMSYRTGSPKPIAVVARELKASHLVEGSVRREANEVRLTLQLIDARTDTPIWSQNYDRPLKEALTLQAQVAAEVAGQMSVRLPRRSQQMSAPTGDTEAFDLYLKAVLALRTFELDWPNFHKIEDQLTKAIDRDSSFALAYAQRARLRTLMFISSNDTSEPFVRSIRADLDSARRLAPKDPNVLAANGYLLMVQNDTTGALAAYDEAEAAGLAEPEWLIPKAHLLLRRSRIEELTAILRHMLVLDPANPLVIDFTAYHLLQARQPVEALRAAEYGRVAFPRVWAYHRARALVDFSGKTDEFRAFLERYEPIQDVRKIEAAPYILTDYFNLLMFEHRYAELKTLLDRVPFAALSYNAGMGFGPVGPTPTAQLRGWTNLMLENPTGAAKEGRDVVKFAAQQTRTKWNAAYLEMLAAEGYTFMGNCQRARAAGRGSLAFVSRSDNAVVWNQMAFLLARVDAWCGAPDEALALLQELATGRPGVGPAVITRDPLLTVPLGKLTAYRALVDRLESEMRVMKLESAAIVASSR